MNTLKNICIILAIASLSIIFYWGVINLGNSICMFIFTSVKELILYIWNGDFLIKFSVVLALAALILFITDKSTS